MIEIIKYVSLAFSPESVVILCKFSCMIWAEFSITICLCYLHHRYLQGILLWSFIIRQWQWRLLRETRTYSNYVAMRAAELEKNESEQRLPPVLRTSFDGGSRIMSVQVCSERKNEYLQKKMFWSTYTQFLQFSDKRCHIQCQRNQHGGGVKIYERTATFSTRWLIPPR